MSEEGLKGLHIKTYDEWLKYYENATKEQVIEDMTHDVLEIDRLNNIINELEKDLEDKKQAYEKMGGGINIMAAGIISYCLNKLKELKEE